MTPFRWALLCLLFTLYLLFGGSIFMLIEQHHELHQKDELHVLRQDIQEILFHLDKNFYNESMSPDVLEALKSAKEGVLNRIASVCSIDNLMDAPADQATPLKWNYYNSVFFSFTVITTIGYGHLSPSASLSKGLMILYALIGIPLNGILLSGIGDYFSNKLIRVHQKSKQKSYRGKHLTLILEIIFYLIPGIVVFMIIPAGMFVLIEDWTFMDSVYYTFVTLTTIGFGDMVAGMGDGHNVWLWLYKVFIIIWITFGLGYLIMILGFIAKGMKSKKVRGVLEKRLTGIRNTKEKLSKDIDYMRKIVNELYLMKLKPNNDNEEDPDNPSAQSKLGSSFGKDGKHSVHFQRRCSSLPRLSTSDLEPYNSRVVSPSHKRRHLPTKKRRLSESDVSSVNRDETFLRRVSVSREELLVTVVNALSQNMMMNVMDAVDELNKYEQEVENGEDESLEESGDDMEKGGKDLEDKIKYGCSKPVVPTSEVEHPDANPQSWALGAVSEFDEEILSDKDMKTEQLECVVINEKSTPEERGSQPSSLIEKVSGAIRKISGTKTPPETPSRKISRSESGDKKRKISRGIDELPHGVPRSHHSPYSPFTRRPSHRRKLSSSTTETDSKHPPLYTKHRKPSSDMRKISQESRVSTISNASSYHTIDEILNSARVSRSRKTTPVHYHPSSPLLRPGGSAVGDHPDGHSTHGKLSETSTSSLAQFLRALDTVQDRLKNPSVCSDSASYFSDHSDAADLSNSFAPSSASKPISGRQKRSRTPPHSADRRRKIGVFQPGFSYVNFGFSPDDEDDVTVEVGEESPPVQKLAIRSQDEFSNNNNNNTSSNNTSNDNTVSKIR